MIRPRSPSVAQAPFPVKKPRRQSPDPRLLNALPARIIFQICSYLEGDDVKSLYVTSRSVYEHFRAVLQDFREEVPRMELLGGLPRGMSFTDLKARAAELTDALTPAEMRRLEKDADRIATAAKGEEGWNPTTKGKTAKENDERVRSRSNGRWIELLTLGATLPRKGFLPCSFLFLFLLPSSFVPGFYSPRSIP